MSLCLITSVQTSLTMPVDLCKILYEPLRQGVQEKEKTFFLLCNMKILCISLLPVYFIKVLRNYSDLLRYNWDSGDIELREGSRGLFPKFTVCKTFCQIYNFYAIWQTYAIKVQSEVIGTSGSCLFGFVHSMYNHFIF